MSDTPETDAFSYECLDSDLNGAMVVSVLVARNLERQRNQARQERDELREALWAMVYCAESKIEPIETLYQAKEILEKLKENKSGGV